MSPLGDAGSLCVGNQAHDPYDWDVASCSQKDKYDINSLGKYPPGALVFSRHVFQNILLPTDILTVVTIISELT